MGYRTISPQQAKKIMDSGTPCTILDVRSQIEYRSGHIKNAVNIPVGHVDSKAASQLPDKSAKILVYCQSGARAAMASRILGDMDYTDVEFFGGINDWPYEVEKSGLFR